MPDKVGSAHPQPTSLRGIANKARVDKRHRFWDLYRCLDAELLLSCWHDLNKDAASGVDKVTAKAYAEELPANIAALAQRLKAKRYRAKLEDKLVQLAGAKRLTAMLAALITRDAMIGVAKVLPPASREECVS